MEEKKKEIRLRAIFDENNDEFGFQLDYIGFDQTKKIKNTLLALSMLEIVRKKELEVFKE